MKVVYFLLLALSVYGSCPNLCSGHGTCSDKGTCTCNRQPGLGLNYGAIDEFAWTGPDCSERTCPKGMTFSFDGDVTVTDSTSKTSFSQIKTTRDNTRLLFESDKERQAEEAADENETPTDPDDVKTNPPTTKPSTAAPTSVNTTSPPIITEAPIVATEPPVVDFPEEIKNQSLTETLPVLGELPKDTEYVLVRCYSGENLDVYLGELKLSSGDLERNTSYLLDAFGIKDSNAIINCNVPYTSTKVSKPSSVSIKKENPVELEIIDSSGKTVIEEVYVTTLEEEIKDDIISKLEDIYGDLGLNPTTTTTAASNERMLDGDCGILQNNTLRAYEYLCIESENPKDGAAFYRMQKIPGTIACNNSNLQLRVSASEMDNIEGLCFFFGNVDSQLPYSEIYPWIGESDGYYYFARFNNKATTIVAGYRKGTGAEGDTTLKLDLSYIPSMIKDNEGYNYPNRPVGEFQVASTPGASVSVQVYNKDDGKFSEPVITTLESSSIETENGGLNITIEVSPKNPIANNGSLIIGNDTETTTAAAGETTPTTTAPTTTAPTTTEPTTTPPTTAAATTTAAASPSTRMRMLDVGPNTIYLLTITKGGPHGFMECSGRGNCDRTTGQCQCYEGFEGSACQRTSCPNNCNNNGRCVEKSESQDNTEVFESKFYGCECDEGFRGPDCSMLECPSGKDPNGATNDEENTDGEFRDCSGRGICDYSTGLCTCFNGYYGSACETQALLQ